MTISMRILNWFRPVHPATYPLSGAERICRIVDLVLVIAMFASFIFADRKSLGFIFLFLEVLFVYKTLFEIHETEKGIVFQRGTFTGTIKPGWHRSLAPFWKIQLESTAVQELVIRDIVMYLKGGTKITIEKMTVFFKITNFKKFIMIEKPKSRLYDEALAKVKGVIGQMTFIKKKGGKNHAIVSEQNFVEGQIKDDLNGEMKPHGVVVQNVALVDIKEEVVSKAQAEKVLGDAIAEKEGKIATALAAPLKDNYPAAAARIGENLSRTLVEISQIKKREERKNEQFKRHA